jgi:ketosteroid isomerase-like protein
VSVESNLELVRGLIRAVDSKDWERVPTFFTESAIFSVPGAPGVSVTVKGIVEARRADAVAFPDTKREIVRAFGEGDDVCVEILETATHMGPVEHGGAIFPPTGRQYRLRECVVYRIQNGKIAEAHVYYDPLEHMSQLGLA